MTERTPDPVELAASVDDLKRKARRRLIGAVVLVLAAAVTLPLLLERDPKPLGEDVSVKIPPVDDGRFVNRLSPKAGEDKGAGKDAAVAKAKSEPAADSTRPAPPVVAATTPAPSEAAPKKSLAEAEQKLLVPPVKAAPAKAAEPAPPPAASPEPKPAAVPAPAVAEKPATPAPAPAKVEKTPTSPPPAKPAAVKEGFVVQLAAFADDKGANSLAGRLKKLGYSAYVEPVETSRGTLWRVRVGPYAERSGADAARAKLKDAGHSGIVTRSK